ncbi:MAG: Vancomycin B-type resistance protein VanW [bacterium ADurb.Bin400]|nr:MAG: Vancomycin B-type resistance protein VanW [bacterium ADurb.Bin400]
MKKYPLKNLRTKKVLAIIGVVLVVVPLIVFGVYSALNHNRVYAYQQIGGVTLTGKTKPELHRAILDKTEEVRLNDIVLTYALGEDDKTFTIKPVEVGVRYDTDVIVDSIWNYGRHDNAFVALWQQIKGLFTPIEHRAELHYDEELLAEKVATIAQEVDLPEKDYSFVYTNGKFALLSDRSDGRRINQTEVRNRVVTSLLYLERNKLPFSAEVYSPQVKEEKAIARLTEANDVLNGGSIVVAYETQEFKFDNDMIGGTIKSKVSGDDLEMVLDEAKINAFVDSVAASIDVVPQNAKLAVKDGKVTAFQIAQYGKTLDKEQTKKSIKEAIWSRVGNKSAANNKPITLKVEVNKPEVTESDIDALGITELIGSAFTEFKGSPANRVHNIETGAAALNGVLLKPGETFSTLARLGEIDDKSGYLPELVIKENRTVPEFGGGLCQVSSTLFRAALNSGMEILERKAHRYRVSYYEPPIGMDATIYDPAPDFKFKNNYNSHVLVQVNVTNYKITFDLYGTKDTREITVGKPETWGLTNPGPPVIIETDTLAPGVKKQLEKAHSGISAKFYYKVTKDGNVLQETEFHSKYVPWPEKWLVGKQIEVAPSPEVPNVEQTPPSEPVQPVQP